MQKYNDLLLNDSSFCQMNKEYEKLQNQDCFIFKYTSDKNKLNSKIQFVYFLLETITNFLIKKKVRYNINYNYTIYELEKCLNNISQKFDFDKKTLPIKKTNQKQSIFECMEIICSALYFCNENQFNCLIKCLKTLCKIGKEFY